MNTFTNAILATSVLAISLDSAEQHWSYEIVALDAAPLEDAHDSLNVPGDLCCRFFEEYDYRNDDDYPYAHGHDYCITDPSGANLYELFDPTWSHAPRARSQICGKNVAVDVCTMIPGNPNNSDWYDRFQRCHIQTAGLVMNPQIDNVGHDYLYINMKYYNPAINGAVTTFSGENCRDSSKRYFGAPEHALGTFYSFSDDMDDVRSVHVPYGYTLITYADSSWEIPVETIIGDYYDHKLQTPKCQNLDNPATIAGLAATLDGPNIIGHQVQGWKVIKNRNAQNPDPAVGFWKSLLVSTESQEFEYHVGVSNTQSTGSSSENASSTENTEENSVEQSFQMTAQQYMERSIQNGIAASVSVGGAFDFLSFGVEVTESQTQTETQGSSSSASTGFGSGSTWGSSQGVSSLVAQDAQISMQEDYGIVHKTTCTTEGATGAGLYQFVYTTSDSKASLFTSHIVCRTGEHWNTPPACTWDACKNADCTCCEGDPDC